MNTNLIELTETKQYKIKEIVNQSKSLYKEFKKVKNEDYSLDSIDKLKDIANRSRDIHEEYLKLTGKRRLMNYHMESYYKKLS